MEELKQEAGKISNLDLQRIVVRVFYYLCVVSRPAFYYVKFWVFINQKSSFPQVTLQYVAPMILIMFLSFMYKTMGGGSWNGLWADPATESAAPATPSPVHDNLESPENAKMDEINEAVHIITGQFSLAWQSLKHVFTPSVFRGIFGFSTWWCCLAWFMSSAIGISYQSYFASA